METMKAIITAVLCVFLTTACSKKLMPPEFETSESVSESVSEGRVMEFDEPSLSDDAFAGSGDSNSISEEPVLEKGFSSDGFFNEEPSDGSSEFSSSPSASGTQEFLLQPFQTSSDLRDIHFKFDKYDLDSNSKMVLQENAAFLKSNPDMQVEIQGHSDERGTNNYNIALGERRANSARNYLVSQGVESKNVKVISYGEEKPFCSESGEICWHQNRRAHFMVSK